MVENHAPIITAFVEDIGRDHRGPGFSFPLHVYMLQDGKGHEVRIPLLKQRFRAYAYFRHGRKDFLPMMAWLMGWMQAISSSFNHVLIMALRSAF